MVSRDRKVSITFYKGLYNFKLEGDARFKGNRRLSLFSLTQKEAEDVYRLLGTRLRSTIHQRTDLD